ncbi:GAF domain-containing protein [Desertifilum sp. FACHB-1129]|uniref:Adenylate cyclase n=2 Tax=Cyanophyceae TaxID=3028117 RepID=A0A1E5QQK7_9CYAN|nr:MULTISPECIES: adenylate/guanylate cyclase domain-containing protein [Cyanophyceae]MCD8485206.1 GAF domain-containing protein [Desertifilum sp.]MDA0212476.1 GAF domain-containing protein [Cyanobacteria bacterium FC1]MBD2313845.1 GAF domain-containing protein [Desertifilum sp. FACHB-1129]MBD2323248.1 GAF domain-containing protein [Desertifilum sp. FACHB-866]MBD2333093.1 GAF domain-containing protein [Desertifilum sp. FACHB-868]
MTLPNTTGSVLATLAQVNLMGALTQRVKTLRVPEFVCLLDFITAEFQQFLRAIDLINNEALESMLEQILDALTLKIGQILQADRTTIFLVDGEKGQLWSKISQSETAKPIEIRIPLNIGIAGHVASTGQCLNISHASSHPLFNKELDKQMGYHTRNLLCMPIMSSKNQVVAVVQLSNKAGDEPFNEEDEQTFRDFASSIGIILETCQSFYMAARNQRGAAALLKATQTLGQSLDVETTLKSVMEQARELMQADRSTLFLLRKESGELWTKVATADGMTMMEIRIPANKGIAGYVASTGEVLNIPNAYEDPRFDPSTDKRTGYVTRNILCMPVFNSTGDLIGVSQLINKHQGSFTSSDEEFMQAFNIQAGIALENAKLFESVLQEKQYQKDILQSLSDAVISTDMQGKIVTLNEAALELLGCPVHKSAGKVNLQLWESKLLGRYVWEVVSVEHLQMRLMDSLTYGTRQYVPEQTLTAGLYCLNDGNNSVSLEDAGICILAIRDRHNPELYIPWNDLELLQNGYQGYLNKAQVRPIERSINLTVNPLTNPDGAVRGGLVVLEDISQEKRMKTTMYRYMNPGVVEQVMARGEDALMEGERKDVTILFSDIRGYTTLTENLGAQEVVRLLNQYFETMVEAVFNYEGTLDKFIGDALMAVFGAPLPVENHAWMAVQSALDMRRRLKEFNNKRFMENQPQIRIGIGISSGEVVSGNIGSQKRMDYTVIGDGVNLSSRLEGVTKEYGCDIIISEFTYHHCADRIWVRELDKIRVKGKNEAVSVYELIGDRNELLETQTREFLDLYSLGRSAYISRDFIEAIHYFEQAKHLQPHDRAVEIHLERSQGFLTSPPPLAWDGAHTLTTK